MNSVIQKMLTALMNVVMPPKCAFCGEIVKGGGMGLCRPCFDKLAFIGDDVCMMCGRDTGNCMCADRSPDYDACVAALYYTDLARAAVLKFKFNGKLSKYGCFAKILARRVRKMYGEQQFDYIVPVPITKKRMDIRGYNQAELMAKAMSRELKLPVETKVLTKVSDTAAQSALGYEERLSNLKDAFWADESVRGKNILLVDDIITTGSTLSECARTLKQAGAQSVRCAVLAATQKKAKR